MLSNIEQILKKNVIDSTDGKTLYDHLILPSQQESLDDHPISQVLNFHFEGTLTKEKARVLVDIISSAILTMDKSKAVSLLEHRKEFTSNIAYLTELCLKAQYFDPLLKLRSHTNCGILDFCNKPFGNNYITDWKKAIQSPMDMINKYVKDKHSEFSAWKAAKFMGTVAGCAIFLWGNVQPILKENQKFNALLVCLGLSAAVVAGFSSYFFKVDPSSHGVPNELFTAR